MTFSSASNSTEELLQIARNAVVAGHRATAARMVNRVLESDPSNKDAWRLLADCMSDPEAKRKCLVKAGDLPARAEQTNYSTERFTTTPPGRVETPPLLSEDEPQPVIVPPRKYKSSGRADISSAVPGKGRGQPPRSARTRKTDQQKSGKRKAGGGCGLLLFIAFLAALAAGFFYIRGDLALDGITTILFPSSQSGNAEDDAVSDLIPPDALPEEGEQPVEIPDANQPQEEADSDLDSSIPYQEVFQIG